MSPNLAMKTTKRNTHTKTRSCTQGLRKRLTYVEQYTYKIRMYYVYKHIDKVYNKKVSYKYIINLESLERNFRHVSLFLRRTVILTVAYFQKSVSC